MSKLSSLAISSFGVSLTSIALLACGGAGTPPPRPPEVAMDPNTTPSTTSADSTPAPDAPSTDGDPSTAMMGGTDPSAASAAPAPAPDATPDPKAGKGKKGKKGAAGGGGGLSKAECDKLGDKGLDLKLVSMGITDPAMVAQLKAQVSSDPNMSGMMSECQKSTTRAQYKCGMAATSESAWETCLK